MDNPAFDFQIHHDIAALVPLEPERIGYAELQEKLGLGKRGRVKRAVSTLVALEVLAWAGVRQGRAVTQGPKDLDDVLKTGVLPMPDRETATYPLLTAAVDEFITQWHDADKKYVEVNPRTESVSVHITASTSTGRIGAAGTHTRPDLTAVVDLQYDHLGPWNELHAFEVKPYWAVDRSGLFEAAAQAALRRCTYSWLLAWIPDPESSHFTSPQRQLILRALDAIPSLQSEASELGLGLLTTQTLGEDALLIQEVKPRRQALDPGAADALLGTLNYSR